MMMKAALRTSFFGFHLRFANNVPVPETPAADNILVKVKAAAINPIDYKLPRTANGKGVGIDFSGVVQSTGSNVKDLEVGDEVFGAVLEEGGSLAEYTTAKAANVAKKPSWLSHTEAAALPVAYLAALQGLRDHGQFAKGGSALIIGASGGAGLAACQLGKAMGASRLVGICSSKNADLVMSHGATEVVDYKNSERLDDFYNSNKEKFDVVLDCATSSGKGEDYTATSLPLLTPQGQYVRLNAPFLMMMKVLVFHRSLGPQQHFFDTLSNLGRQDLEDVVSLLRPANMKPMTSVLPFTEEGVLHGFDQLKSRRVRGKLVFDVDKSVENQCLM
jgi:NADPH:quinone reductase-like Zn-dependent oxidoreductase